MTKKYCLFYILTCKMVHTSTLRFKYVSLIYQTTNPNVNIFAQKKGNSIFVNVCGVGSGAGMKKSVPLQLNVLYFAAITTVDSVEPS